MRAPGSGFRRSRGMTRILIMPLEFWEKSTTDSLSARDLEAPLSRDLLHLGAQEAAPRHGHLQLSRLSSHSSALLLDSFIGI